MTSSEEYFQSHPVFTHEEYARSRDKGSPRTVDSLLRKHAESGRIVRVRRGLYVSVPPGTAAETVDPYLLATKATSDAAVSHHAALQFHGRTYSLGPLTPRGDVGHTTPPACEGALRVVGVADRASAQAAADSSSSSS